MVDWSVLDRSDPAPGNPSGVRDLARRLNDEASRVRDTVSRLEGLSSGSGALAMEGDYAAGYRQVLSELPGELNKLGVAHGGAGAALDRFAGSLEQAQAQAGTALRRGTDADTRYRGALNELRALLPGDRRLVLLGGVNLNSWTLDAATIGMDESTRDRVRVAGARARRADEDLDAAKRLADQAASLREDAERRCERELDDAGDPIADKAWYEKAWDFVSAPFRSWDDFVELCRNVALVVGIVALFVSGPVGWALMGVALAASAVAFADDLGRYARGEIGLGGLALGALGLIPFAPGALRLAALGPRLLAMGRGLRAGGGALLAAGGRAVRGAIPAIRNGIGGLRAAAGDLASSAWRLVADPIDPVSGDMILPQEDLSWDGVLPLRLERVHRSSYRAGRWFGPTWASTLDQRLELDGGSAFVALADGALLVFAVPEPGGAAVLPEHGPRLELAAVPDGTWTLTDPATRQVLHFAAAGSPDAGVLPLQRITDANGNSLDLTYEGDQLTGLRHSGGYRVRVETSGGLVMALHAATTSSTATGEAGETGEVTLRRFAYDSSRRLVQVFAERLEDGPQVFDYEADGRITRWQDRNGTWYRYEYDGAGRAVRTQGSDHCLDAVLEYGETTRRWTNSLGATTTYRVVEDQPVEITDPLGASTTYRWGASGHLLEETDPLGRVTRYVRDENGDVVTVVRADGSRRETRYAAPGRPELVQEPDGTQSRWTYDEHGRVLTETGPAGATTAFGYDERGGLSHVTDPLGATTMVTNDAAGLPVLITDAAGGVTRIRRDGWGRVVALTDPVGETTTLTWTAAGLLTSATRPGGGRERWSYDGEGNTVEHVDAAGGVTRFETWHFDLPATRTTPDGARTAMVHDTELRPVAVIDARGLQWRYEYDAAGRVVSETDYDGRVLRYRYDAAGQLVERVNGAGESLTLVRDRLGRVVEERSGDRRATFTYDACGRLLRAVNDDADVELVRDAAGQVVSESCDGRAVVSTWDAAGRRVGRRTPAGVRSHWTYDACGRPVSLRTGGRVLTFTRDAAGREVERDLGAATLRQEWGPGSRVTSRTIVSPAGRGTGARRTEYRYRADGYLTSAGERRYDLDPMGRVTGVTTGAVRESYRYDPAGSVTAASWPAGPRSSAESSSGSAPEPGTGSGPEARAESAGRREFSGTRPLRAGRVTYRFDAQGRLTLRRVRLLTGGTRDWRYEWDALDRLTAVLTPGGTRWRYRYDALGRRVAKERLDTGGEVAERMTFSWDGHLPVEERHDPPEEHRGAPEEHLGARTVTWEWDPVDAHPLLQLHRSSEPGGSSESGELDQDTVDERFHAIVTDLVGTPTELVGETGRVLPQESSLWGHGGTWQTPLRFPGQYADEESGLHYNLFRHYDPGTGQYVSPDPLGLEAGVNHRQYVTNPLHWIDPLGLLSCSRLLGRNMAREGRPVGPGQAAAHIVASTGARRHWAPAAQARALLQRYGVDINDAANGIPLGHARPHNFTHHRAFHERVRDSLSDVAQGMADQGRGARAIRSALRNRLREIGRDVEAELAGGTPASWAVWTAP